MKVLLSGLKFFEYAVSRFEDLEGEDFELLKQDLANRGQEIPIIIDQHNFVLDGRQRVRAAIELGWTDIEVIQKQIDEEEKKKTAVNVNALRRHLTKQAKLKLLADLAEAYMPIREENLKKRQENLKRGKVNKIKGSPEVTTVVTTERKPQEEIRQEIQKLAREKGEKISTSEADKVSQIVSQAKKEHKTVAEVISQQSEDEKPKTAWERAEERFATDMQYRSKIFQLFKAHSTVHSIQAHELPLRIKTNYNANRAIWVVSV